MIFVRVVLGEKLFLISGKRHAAVLTLQQRFKTTFKVEVIQLFLFKSTALPELTFHRSRSKFKLKAN